MRKIIHAFLIVPIWLSFPVSAQFTFKIDQSIPVVMSDQTLSLAWAGGLNSAQINTMDLNGDGKQDLVIFERAANKVFTYLNKSNSYVYDPSFETLFPSGLDQWVLLRDFNGDGKKDIFTSDPFGMKVFVNTTKTGNTLSWRSYDGGNPLLTIGFGGKTNLQVNGSDISSIDDMDGDGDLDILVARFVGVGSLEYHKNMSVENTGKTDSLQLQKITQTWGDFEECNCGKFIYLPVTSCPTGGRVNHAAGKSILTIDLDNDGDRDLLFSEETCANLYLLPNQGTKDTASMSSSSSFPTSTPVNFDIFPAGFYEDVTFDGLPDLIVSSNIYSRTTFATSFNKTMWLYKNTGTLKQPDFTFVKNNFLQDQMIDVGDSAVPAFFDLDNDGDLDMIIGTYGNESNTSFYHYENIGTKTDPSFKFVTSDYINFSTTYKGLYNLKPQFADMDGDGKTDFVFTATDLTKGLTTLYYLQNKNANGMDVNGQPLLSTNHTIDSNENLLVTDVEQDGITDLLIGTSTGAIEYWINYGPNGSFNYALKNSTYLGFDVSTDRQNIALSAGDLNSDGKQELVIGNQNGMVSIVENFRSQKSPATVMTEIIVDPNSDSLTQRKLNGRVWPVPANLFNTKYGSIMVGTITGGLNFLKNENAVLLPSEPTISIYPNPVGQTETLLIQADRNMSVQFLTIQGQQLSNALTVTANQANSYSVSNLAAGVYIAIFEADNQKFHKKFIVH